MLIRIRSFLAPPVFENDEDSTRLARFVSYFIWTLTFSALFFSVIWLLTSPELAGRMVFALPIFPLAGLIFYFLKRKKMKMAGSVLVAGLWIVLFVAAFFSGGIHAPAIGGFVVVVLLAALLLGRGIALGFAGLSILTSLGLVIGENVGKISGEQFSTPFAIWASYTAYLVVAGTLLHMATNSIQEALSRARQEIEERKRTEVALREAELRYRTLVEHLPVVTYRDAPNMEATALYVSPQIENLIGYSPDEWLDQPNLWQELLHPEDYERVMTDVREYILRKNRSAIEYRMRTRDGRWVWVRDEADVLKDEHGDPLFVQGTLSDITDRIQAEQALRTSEEKFNKAFDFSPFPMAITSPTRGYLETNEAFLNLLGRTREEVIGQYGREVGFWAETEEQAQALEILRKEGGIRDFEFRFQKKSGEVGVGLTSAAMITINDDPCALVSVFDLTQRLIDEEALRNSEDKFQKAFLFSPIAMAISSPTRGYLDINDAFVKITGYTREETLGRFSADIRLWTDSQKHRKTLGMIQEAGFARDIEIGFRKKSGEEGTALASGVLIEFENEQCILVSIYDITDRKISEVALKASEEKFQKAFLSSPVSMMIDSPVKGILNVNQAFEALTGFERTSILGQDALDIGLWVNEEVWQQTIEMVGQQGSLHDFEFQFRKKNGEVRIGSLGVDQIEIENETCYLASFQDITTRKETEETLKNINSALEARVQNRTAQLKAANQELESFSYSISHDLRSPLRAINGFSRLLVEGYHDQLSSEAKRLLGLVQDNALKMGRLIDDLLAFSRLGRSPLQVMFVKPNELVDEVWESLTHERINRKIEMTVAELEPCQADPALLRQVFANLLSNAIKFTRPRELARIEVGNHRIEGQNVYFVKDNGAGFDMEYSNKLFGVFQRLHHENEFEGTGVGLAIVQRIIHRHSGKIWAEAEPNKGATFFFTIPQAQN